MQDPPHASIEIKDERAIVRGVVRENVQRCQVDGPCYLRLSAVTGEVRVYYHHGEAPPCPNESSTRTGLRGVAGDSIEASGIHAFAEGIHRVDVCCPDCSLTIANRP